MSCDPVYEPPICPAGVDRTALRAEIALKLAEVLQTVREARAYLLAVRRLIEHADDALEDLVGLLAADGRRDLAACVQLEVIEENFAAERWVTRLIEEFDRNYYAAFQRMEESVPAEVGHVSGDEVLRSVIDP
ncbi:hypothetical protein GCM10022247_29600 [Allokutzneria multivorans]|uniref:Uncharacterized protein n=1 Tax=Allokutzneria multivorans TaxID=1142134 RepID=A0ABP7S3X7_9PSEU